MKKLSELTNLGYDISEFISEAKKVHKNFYTYEIATPFFIKNKIKIICPKHGSFLQYPYRHLIKRSGCQKCAQEELTKSKIKTKDYFLKRAVKKHGTKYIYDQINYVNFTTKIKIICKKHGPFYQSPNVHVVGAGCKKCATEYTSKKLSKNTAFFIKKAKLKHGNTYDYSLSKYTNIKTKLKIICKKHGVFLQKPQIHYSCRGCLKCYLERQSLLKRKSTKIFLKQCEKVHGSTYDYSLVNYVNKRTKVKIICKKHGLFEQKPQEHLKGCGCQHCNISKGEDKIKRCLDKKGVTYTQQKFFEDCKNPKTGRKLFFDFYVKDYNLLIEYDGEQHFKTTYKGGLLRDTQYRDRIKTKYAKQKRMCLKRIPYWKFKKIT